MEACITRRAAAFGLARAANTSRLMLGRVPRMLTQTTSRGLASQHVVRVSGGRKRLGVRADAVGVVGGVIHISETWIVAGSAALALSVPVALRSVSMGRVQSVSPSDASILLSTGSNTKLVDVRSRLEVKIEGLPLNRHVRKACVIHAPFNELRGGKLRPVPSFVDDIIFSPGVNDSTTYIIMSSRGSDTCRRAVEAIAALGGRNDVFTVEGGFRAWQAAGMDTESAALMSGEFGTDSNGGSVLGSSDDERYDYYGDGSGSNGSSTTSSGETTAAAGGSGRGGGRSGRLAAAAAGGVEEMYLDAAAGVGAGAGGPLAAQGAAL